MLKLKVERAPAPRWAVTIIPVVAVLVTFLISSILVILADANPFAAFYNFIRHTAFQQILGTGSAGQIHTLILTGMAVTFAFTSGYFNIGAEGQLYAGAIAATWVGITFTEASSIVIIPLMIIAGCVGGLLWALIPALLKVKLKVDEVVTTLLMNSIIMYFISWLLNGPWRSPVSGWPQSPEISEAAHFLRLVPKSRLHIGFLIALVVVVLGLCSHQAHTSGA